MDKFFFFVWMAEAKTLEEIILDIWNKQSDPSLLTKNLHKFIENQKIENAPQTLSSIFIKILSKGFFPSEFLSTLLKHCISTEFIPEFIFFEELSKEQNSFENENFMELCFEIFENFLPQMNSKNGKRKYEIDFVVHYETFLFKFLEYSSSNKKSLESSENLQKCFKLLEKLNLNEKILKQEMNLIKDKEILNKFKEIYEKKKNKNEVDFVQQFSKNWISLDLQFQLEQKPIFIDHWNFDKSKEILKNFQKFKKFNNSTFLFQIWLNILKFEFDEKIDQYISNSFYFWKLPKLIDEIFIDEIEIEESFEIFSTLNFNEEKFEKIKKYFFIRKKNNISIKNISKCIELLLDENLENQSEIISHIFETNCLNDGKQLISFVNFLNENEKFLDFFHFHGRIVDLLDILLKNLIQLESKKTGSFSEYFKLIFSIILRFDLLNVNRGSFIKLLKQNSNQEKSNTISWFSSLLFDISFNPETSILDNLSS